MTYTLLRLEDVQDRAECFVQVLFADSDTGASIPYAQWITGVDYERYSADHDTLDAIVAEWETEAKQRYYDESTITPAQARLALLNVGLLDAVDAFIAEQPRMVQLAWEYTTTVRRDSPLIVQATNELGWTSEQVNALFDAASKIQI